MGLPDAPVEDGTLSTCEVADLHYRGYSVINRPNAGRSGSSGLQSGFRESKQSWRDLEGYYTRFGEVGELLQAIDDRYVIVTSGDEMSLRFPEQPPPPAGWVRDYIIMGDGWIKDGDYNSTFSQDSVAVAVSRATGIRNAAGQAGRRSRLSTIS